MKKIAVLLMFAVTCFFACSKSSGIQNESLIGRWTLTERLNDPGNGSGTWMPAADASDYIQFNADGSAESPSNPYNGGVNGYNVTADSTLTLLYNNGTSYAYRYYINGTTLTIMGGCIEACGSRYRKTGH